MVLHSSNELRGLSQWLYCNDSTVNIVLIIIIIIIKSFIDCCGCELIVCFAVLFFFVVAVNILSHAQYPVCRLCSGRGTKLCSMEWF